MDKKHCKGCRNDFYNGYNNLGVKECWSLKSATLMRRIPIGYWEPPPYLNKKKVQIPACYHEEGPNKTIYVKPEAIGPTGYWGK